MGEILVDDVILKLFMDNVVLGIMQESYNKKDLSMMCEILSVLQSVKVKCDTVGKSIKSQQKFKRKKETIRIDNSSIIGCDERVSFRIWLESQTPNPFGFFLKSKNFWKINFSQMICRFQYLKEESQKQSEECQSTSESIEVDNEANIIDNIIPKEVLILINGKSDWEKRNSDKLIIRSLSSCIPYIKESGFQELLHFLDFHLKDFEVVRLWKSSGVALKKVLHLRESIFFYNVDDLTVEE